MVAFAFIVLKVQTTMLQLMITFFFVSNWSEVVSNIPT